MTKFMFSDSMGSECLALRLESLPYRFAGYTGNLVVSHAFSFGIETAPDPAKT